jgi:hypothetical protein
VNKPAEEKRKMHAETLDKIPHIVSDVNKTIETYGGTISWSAVLDVLVRSEGKTFFHGDFVIASGEVFTYAYSPYHYAPMYLGLKGCLQRLHLLTGVKYSWRKGPARGGDVEEAWNFIREKIDAGHGIHVEGPESFLIYGYKDNGDKRDRCIKCLAQWGPGLDDEVKWEEPFMFPMFSFSTIELSTSPGSITDIVTTLVKTILDYQEEHPGIGTKVPVHHEVQIEDMKGKEITLTKTNFGLTALDQYIHDIQDEHVFRGMLQAYHNCHAINFHIWGRLWQGEWFERTSSHFKDEIAESLMEAGKSYKGCAAKLQEYVDVELVANYPEKLEPALIPLQEAYKHEEKAITALKKAANNLNI